MRSRLSTGKSLRLGLRSWIRHSRTRHWVVVSLHFRISPDGADRLTLIDYLQVALDVSSDGQLQLPPYPSNATSGIWNITIFLSSYVTGWNFTISNGTASRGNASLGEIMQQEPGSTVKHVNWVWPDCLVGNGPPGNNNSARGLYNVCATS
jgi:hypothetical protein